MFRASRFETLEERAMLSAMGGKETLPDSALFGQSQLAAKTQHLTIAPPAVERRSGAAQSSSTPAGCAVSAEIASAIAGSSSVPSSGRLYALRVNGKQGTIYEVSPANGSILRSFPAPTAIRSDTYQGLALGPASLFFIDGTEGDVRTLYELDLDTGAVIDNDVVDLSVRDPVIGLAYYDGKIYLGRTTDSKLLIWDPDADKMLGSLTTTYKCGGGLTGADSLGLFDSNYQGQIVFINPANGTSKIIRPGGTTESMSGGLAFVEGKLFAGERTTGKVYRIDPTSGKVIDSFVLQGAGTLTGLAGDGLVETPPPPPGEIRGHHWNDLDGNGFWDPGEPPLADWTVFLDLNQNGMLDPDDISTQTGPNGEYAFADLAPGAYTVAVQLPASWTQTWPSAVPSAGRLYALRASEPTPSEPTKKATVLELNPDDGTIMNRFEAPGVITEAGCQGLALGPDRLYYIDGTGDVAHTLYELELNTGKVLDSDAADKDHQWRCAGLGYLNGEVYLLQHRRGMILVWDPVSDTVVRELTVMNATLQGGFTGAADLGLLFDGNSESTICGIDPKTGSVVQKLERIGAGQLNGGMAYFAGELIAYGPESPTAKRIDPTTGAVLGQFTVGGSEYGILTGLAGDGVTEWFGPRTRTVVVQSEETVENVDFGSGQFTEIRGGTWHDLDGDGAWDPDEPPLEGWTILLDGDGNGVRGGERSAVTDASGQYAFTLLPPGRFTVAELTQSSWLPTLPQPTPSKGRLYAFWADGAHGTGSAIARIDPRTGSVLGGFPAPATVSYSGPQGLALGADRLFYIDGCLGQPQILYQLDLDTGGILASSVVDEEPAEEITGMAYLDGLVYLERCDADQILAWDPAAGAIVATFNPGCDLGGSLTGAADRGLLFAGNTRGEIFTIDPASGEVVRTLQTDVGPFSGGLAYLDGVLFAAEYAGTTAQRIDAETGTRIGQITLTRPSGGDLCGLAADGVGGSSGTEGVYLVDAAPGTFLKNLDFGNRYSPASAALASVDLAGAFDTGFSSNDDLTRRDNSNPDQSLDFVVAGTIAGAVVEVYADGILIGRGEATGSPTTITTRGDFDLADGPHAITARQTEQGKQPSADSPALTIWIDTACPSAEILEVTPDPRDAAVDAIDVEFSEQVIGVAVGSFCLSLDGGGNRLAGAEPITSLDQQRFTLGGLALTTADAGRYRLLLAAESGIRDLAGNPLAGSASDEWTQYLARHTGTAGADTIRFSSGAAHTLSINGRAHVYDPAAVTELVLDGLGGGDSITIAGLPGGEEVLLDGTSVSVAGSGYRLTAVGFARIAVDAGAAGGRLATLRGASDGLRLYSYADWSALCDSTGSFYHRVEGFESVAVEAAASGRDYAFLYDSSGDDRLTASADQVEMDRAPGWSDVTVSGFSRVYSYATGGFDAAELTNPGLQAERFYGYPDYSILTDSPGSFYYYASGFDSVTASASGIGARYAYLYDSAGNDALAASPSEAAMDRQAPWSDVATEGFSRVYAYSIRGGEDSAALTGADEGGNRLYGYAAYSTLSNSAGSFYHYVSGFAELSASVTGDDNLAYLYGSAGDDILTARPLIVELDRAAGWSDTAATGFERVYAYASGGGIDRARLYDSAESDTLFGRRDYGYLTDSHRSYYLYFKYFDEVFAHSEDEGGSIRDLVNIDKSLLYLLSLEGAW